MNISSGKNQEPWWVSLHDTTGVIAVGFPTSILAPTSMFAPLILLKTRSYALEMTSTTLHTARSCHPDVVAMAVLFVCFQSGNLPRGFGHAARLTYYSGDAVPGPANFKHSTDMMGPCIRWNMREVHGS